MKVYSMNEWDWVCANSKEEAGAVYKYHLSRFAGIEPRDLDVHEVLEERMGQLRYNDEDGGRTFAEELARREQPEFFASTEL